MALNVAQSVRIKGKSILHGEVYLSGDPLSSIFHIALAIFDERNVRIKNVPRCKLLLDFIFVIENLGIKVSWEDESTILVDGRQEIRENLVNLYEGSDYGFASILIPVVLKRQRECEVHPNLRTEVKFFRELGVSITNRYNILSLKVPLDINFDIKKNYNLFHADPFMVASKLFTSKIFKNLSVDYDQSDPVFKFYRSSGTEISGITEYKSSYNQCEFNLYASIACFSNAEVSLTNFDLSESLNFLLSLDEIGFRYEVLKTSIKIWYVGSSDLGTVLDWSGHSFNNICHLILLLSKITKRTVKILCISYPKLDELVTDLNIMGCRIEIEEGKKGYSLVTIKPPSAFSSVKNSISDLSVGSAVLAFACCYSGNSRISGFEVISEYMPYLIDNLRLLNVDITDK